MQTQVELSYEQLARELVDRVLAPQAFDTDVNGEYPADGIQALAKSGLMGVLIPQEYGGLGGTLRDFTRVTEILAQGCVSTAALYLFHGQVARRVVDFGTLQQKRDLLPNLASGEWLGASSWSELTAGSNKSGTRSNAAEDGEMLMINGHKTYCTGAGEAGLYTVLLRTGEEQGRELSFVLLYGSDEGMDFGHAWDGMGLRGSSTKEIICRDVLVPRDRVLGGEFGRGNEMMAVNRGTAIHPGILSLGIAKAAIEALKEQLQVKPHLWDYQNIRMNTSELLIKVHALELLIYRAAELADLGDERSTQLTMEAKVLGAQTGVLVTDIVMQMCGAAAYTRGHKMERLYRDAKAMGLMGPTTELSKEFIANDWWKKGAETWEESILTS